MNINSQQWQDVAAPDDFIKISRCEYHRAHRFPHIDICVYNKHWQGAITSFTAQQAREIADFINSEPVVMVTSNEWLDLNGYDKTWFFKVVVAGEVILKVRSRNRFLRINPEVTVNTIAAKGIADFLVAMATEIDQKGD